MQKTQHENKDLNINTPTLDDKKLEMQAKLFHFLTTNIYPHLSHVLMQHWNGSTQITNKDWYNKYANNTINLLTLSLKLLENISKFYKKNGIIRCSDILCNMLSVSTGFLDQIGYMLGEISGGVSELGESDEILGEDNLAIISLHQKIYGKLLDFQDLAMRGLNELASITPA